MARLGAGGMQDVVQDDAEGDVDVEGAAFAVHGQEHGRIASRQRCFGNAVVFMANDEAGFLGVGKGMVGNGRVRQLHRHHMIPIRFQISNRLNRVLLITPGNLEALKPAYFVNRRMRRRGGDAGQHQFVHSGPIGYPKNRADIGRIFHTLQQGH